MKEIDRLLEEALPEDVEEAVTDDTNAESTSSSGPYKQLKNLTLVQQIPEEDVEDVFEAKITEIATDLDIEHSGEMIATQLATQYLHSADMPGRIVELYAAAIVYCACKVSEIPVVPEEVADAGPSMLSRKMLLRRSKTVASEVGLDPSAFIEATQYATRFCDELDLGEDVRERTEWILDTLDDDGLASGKSPTGWAAAAVYNAALDQGIDIRQKDVADVANVTVVTIRNRYQEQRVAYSESETLPGSSEACLDYFSDILSIEGEVKDDAHDLIEAGKKAGFDVDEDPVIWAAASLRAAHSRHDESVSVKTLKQYLDGDRNVSSRERALKDAYYDRDNSRQRKRFSDK